MAKTVPVQIVQTFLSLGNMAN